MTAVTCPILRYHPAVVAQAAATIALLSGSRFVLGLGAGERLNEHVTGEGWPGVAGRHERLGEAIEIIRGLLSGNKSRFEGRYFRLDHARLFDRPDRPPPIVIAAGGEHAAALAGRSGAGLIATEPRADLVKAYRAAGGKGPCYAEVAMCFAGSEETARQTAHKYFRWSLLGPAMADIPNVEVFGAATKALTPEAVAEQISCGPDPERHLAAIGDYAKAGFDHLILVQIGPEQDAFIDFFERELAPRLRRKEAAE